VAIPLNQHPGQALWQQMLYQWALTQAQAQHQAASAADESDWLGVWN
jgi:hypothetical protein